MCTGHSHNTYIIIRTDHNGQYYHMVCRNKLVNSNIAGASAAVSVDTDNKIDLPTTLPLDDDGDLVVVSPRWSLIDASKSLFKKIDQQNVKGFFDELMKCPVSHIDDLVNARCTHTNKCVL